VVRWLDRSFQRQIYENLAARKRPPGSQDDIFGQSITTKSTSSGGRGSSSRKEDPGRPALEEPLKRHCSPGVDASDKSITTEETSGHQGARGAAALGPGDGSHLHALTPVRKAQTRAAVRSYQVVQGGEGLEAGPQLCHQAVGRQAGAGGDGGPGAPGPASRRGPLGGAKGGQEERPAQAQGTRPMPLRLGTDQCPFRATVMCNKVHPGALTTSQGSPRARDELQRMTRHHPHQHMMPGAYQINGCEFLAWAWKAGLIRQVDKWIEWHDSGRCPAQGTGEGPEVTGSRAEGGGGKSGVDDGLVASVPEVHKRPRSPSPDASSKSTATEGQVQATAAAGRARAGPPLKAKALPAAAPAAAAAAAPAAAAVRGRAPFDPPWRHCSSSWTARASTATAAPRFVL
jgi:hypothetical protein